MLNQHRDARALKRTDAASIGVLTTPSIEQNETKTSSGGNSFTSSPVNSFV
jgi:hypothetical protein